MSLEEVAACPICGKSSFKHLLSCNDHTTSGELFHVKQCETCGLVLTSPRPPSHQAQPYYESKEYISHTSAPTNLINHIYLIIRYFTLKWKFRLVKKYLQSGTLLDFGCGTGNFLEECKRHDSTVFGVEPSEQAQKKIASEIQLYNSLDTLPEIKFNVITLWHVLEHIYPLAQTLEKIKARLDQDGTIFIAVPNRESFDAAYYKEMWAAYDVPRHLWHFSKDSMAALLKKSGLRVQRIVPMRLDAYYVSLLSEKDRSQGKLTIRNCLRALLVGMRSNFQAKQAMNYSSLIFIIKKQ